MSEPFSAHAEDGAITPAVEFDYDLVEQNLFGPKAVKELKKISSKDIEAARQAFRILLQWVFQNGMKNPDGLKIRTIICCWIYLEELRPMTLTELAIGFGMKKQSLGRWVDEFKKDFPDVRIPHMR